MKWHMTSSLVVAACGALLFAATPSYSAVLTDVEGLRDAGASSMVQQVRAAPPGTKCMKWTRRWNPTFGFGRRRCVQWR